jgi:multidrug transporter EmrE-like cation transporter
MSPLFFITIGGLVLTIGDIVLKLWVEKHLPWLYFLGLLLYTIAAMFLVESYKSQNIAIATALFIICNLVTLTLVSWMYFGETLATRKLIGLAASAISVCLMI